MVQQMLLLFSGKWFQVLLNFKDRYGVIFLEEPAISFVFLHECFDMQVSMIFLVFVIIVLKHSEVGLLRLHLLELLERNQSLGHERDKKVVSVVLTICLSLCIVTALSAIETTIAAASITVTTLFVRITAKIVCWFLFGRLSRVITRSWSMSPASLAGRLRFFFMAFPSDCAKIFTMMSWLAVFLFTQTTVILHIFRGWTSPPSSVAFLSSYYSISNFG